MMKQGGTAIRGRRNRWEIVPVRKSSSSSHIRRALMYITRNYREPLSEREIAERLSITPEYFSALFRHETGMTFTSYCNALRINRSVFYLRCTDYSVKRIAHEVGFNTPSYFIRLFSLSAGMTPLAYRLSQVNKSL